MEETFDVVILGGGGTGLAAAVAAARKGARTLVLERLDHLGGTTQLAVGSITGAGTRMQRAAGIDDRVEDFHADMDLFTADLLARDNRRLRAMLAAEAGPTIDWLEDLGVAFAGPYPEPPHRTRRMHNTIPGPRAIIARLEKAARAAGVQFRLEAQVLDLNRDESGAVTGVAYEWKGERAPRFNVAHARRGVILATGDFSGNAARRHELLPAAAARATPINSGNLGGGHDLAVKAGGVLRNMDAIFGPQMRFPRARDDGWLAQLPSWPWLSRLGAWYFMHAPSWMLKPLVAPLLVSNMSPAEGLFAAGARLLDCVGARLDTSDPSFAIATAQKSCGYIVLDARMAKQFSQSPHFISTAPGIAYAYLPDYLRARPDIAQRFASPQAMADALGMQADQVDVALQGLQAGELIVLGPVQAMLTTTEGGADVDENCRVLRADGTPVKGLYAAGCVGQGGLLLRGHGLHLAWVFASGRMAGQTAASE